MAGENIEVFRRGAEATNRGDIEAVLEVVHPEVVLEPLRAATEGAFVGHAGIRKFLADTTATFEVFRVDYADVRDLGDRVLAIGSIRVQGRGSGIETDVPTAVVAEYRDGLLWRFKDHGEARLALEAAGLEESSASRERVDQVMRFMEAYNRRDVEAMLEDLDPEVEWHPALLVPLEGKATVYRGHEGVRIWVRDLDEVFADIHAEYSEIRDLGEQLVAIGRIRMRGTGSGAETESPVASVIDYENDKAVRVRTFLDPGEALNAAGLEE